MDTAEKVTPLRAVQAPALGMSVVMNMPGDRQATLQCFIGSDDSLEAQHALMDRMFAIADRQKARYELTELRDRLNLEQKTLDHFEEDRERVDGEKDKEVAKLRVQIAEFLKMAEEAEKDGYNAHVRGGRRGEYKPQGATKQRVEVAKAQAKQFGDKIDQIMADKMQFMSNLDISQARRREEIGKLKVEIARREKLIG